MAIYERFLSTNKNEPITVEGIDFDITDSFNGYDLDGLRFKKFARYPSSVFAEYIDVISNQRSSSYSSYANGIIKEGVVPETLCALSKDTEMIIDCVAEVVAGKILNYFEVPVTFETFAKNEDGNLMVLSLDFIESGERFYSLDELGVSIEDLREVPKSLSKRVFEIFRKKEFGIKTPFDFNKCHNMISQLSEDVVYSILVRSQVLRDNDLHEGNMGVLINADKGTIRMAPNFDLELCFAPDYAYLNRGYDGLLGYVEKYYPKVYQKFVKKFYEFNTKFPLTGKRFSNNLLYAKSGNAVFRLDKEHGKMLDISLSRVEEKLVQIECGKKGESACEKEKN
ncbi:MAG: hypothetical protein IJW59_00165 [Clostridia bacterium]|nr:hypothetical protein [Clostridia bacterium]